ncbi:MAG: hypothetical protein JHC84_22435 [Solirubrobacteraceae bacterium]|nr:hypothetical protein [Solirubrobacteraceae bacterium]
MAIPVIGFTATLIVTIVRLARKKTAFWVPLAGTAGFALGFVAAVAFAFSGLG